MKAKIVISTFVLMFSAFAWSVFGGTEGPSNTFYGTNAGQSTTGDEFATFIGYGAGSLNTSGAYNTFVGYVAGYNNTTGAYNTFVGFQAGYSNTGGSNTFIGHEAGYNNTTGFSNFFGGTMAGFTNTTGFSDTFIGSSAGNSNTTGYANTFGGTAAGYSNTTGYANTFGGSFSGFSNSTGAGNVSLGSQAGYNNSTGIGNTFLGTMSGYSTTGSINTFLGAGAGGYNISGIGDVFLGYQAGESETGSNKLYIANSNTSTPLIWGDFTGASEITGMPTVAVNGYLGIGTQAPVRMVHLSGPNAVFRMDRTVDSAAFQIVRTDISGNPLKVFVVGVNASGTGTGEFIINDNGTALSGGGTRRMTMANNGDVTFTGNLFANNFNPSSLTLKDNVRTYENALDTVNRLRGVSFDWKDSGKPSVGLIAEEVAKVVPEVVAYNDGAAAGVNYASLVGVLVEAVKEQQAQHKAEIDSLKKEQQEAIRELQERLIALERK